MTGSATPKPPEAIALGLIRPLSSQSARGALKTVSTMRHDLDRIRTIADDALALAPTPVPVPPAPVPVPPTPVPVPPTPQPPGAVMGDDFTRYAGTLELRSALTSMDPSAKSLHLASIDRAVTFRGHQTMRYDHLTGSSMTPNIWPRLPALLSDAWLAAAIRFSPGFTTKGQPIGAFSYKLLDFLWDTASGRGGVEITGTNQYQLSGGAKHASGPGVPTIFANAGKITTEWGDGAFWWQLLHIATLSPTSMQLRYWRWRDGAAAKPLRATIVMTGPAFTVKRACLGLNRNVPPLADMSLNYGEYRVWDGSKVADPMGVGG